MTNEAYVRFKDGHTIPTDNNDWPLSYEVCEALYYRFGVMFNVMTEQQIRAYIDAATRERYQREEG